MVKEDKKTKKLEDPTSPKSSTLSAQTEGLQGASKKTGKQISGKKDKLAMVEEMANKLLELMGTNAKAQVAEDKENQAVSVDIQTQDEVGLLIGNRGRTLNAIQRMLGMMYRQETGEWQRILVNIADWREKEKGRLEQLARQIAERAKSTGEPQSLYNLTSPERRIIHLVLADDKEVKTESHDEGKDRYLVVHPSE